MNQRALSIILVILTTLAAAVLATAVWFIALHYRPAQAPPAEASTDSPPVSTVDTASAVDTNGPVAVALSGIGGAPELPTIPPWPTMQNTPTPTPPAAPSPAPLPTLEPPQRVAVNGVAWENIVVIPPDVDAHVREIAAAGRALGRNPAAYSVVGDSTVEAPHFMTRFDEGPYNLGAYAHLQPVIDHYHGSHGRDSIAVRIGLHAWTANDPMWAEAGLCLPNETPVECEIRVHNPSVILIRLGSNDVGVGGMFDANIRHIVETAVAAGVIPVIGTKGDRHEGSNENNDILRRVAADYRLPLWDYDLVAATLPGRGLDVDATHMLTYYAHDYSDPTAFTRGHAMHNLTALMILDAIWRITNDG